MATGGRGAAGTLAMAAALAGGLGCGGPARKQTASEWIDENTNILSQLRSYDHEELHEGIQRFLKLGRERGTEVVNYLLNDPHLEDYRVEVVLARILAEWKDSRAIPKLVENLRGRDAGAVAIAKEGLIIFGDDARILEAMRSLIEESEVDVRRNAAEVLSEMRGPEAVRLLGEHYRTEDNLDIRGICVTGIGDRRTRSERKAEFLVEALDDKDVGIRQAAWDALVTLGAPAGRFDPAGSPEARQAALGELRAWASKRGRVTGSRGLGGEGAGRGNTAVGDGGRR